MNRKGLPYALICLCIFCGGVTWLFFSFTSPQKCVEYPRSGAQGAALLCTEETTTDNTTHLYVRIKRGWNTPLIYVGKVSDSEESSYFSGCYWSKDNSIFIATVASNRPNAPLGSSIFKVGYDFRKRQTIRSSQFINLLKNRGGAGPSLG